MVIISSAEMSIGIVAANMPALKAFWSCWRQNKLGAGKAIDLTGSNSAAISNSARSQSGAIELSSELGSSKNATKLDTGYSKQLTATESEEKLCET